MSIEERAAKLTHDEIVALLRSHDELTRQMDWLKRQLFGQKSERRVVDAEGRQLFLGELDGASPAAAERTIPVAGHARRVPVEAAQDEADEAGLRFDESVPVEEIRIPSEELPEGEYEVVSEKVTHRLAQRPGSYVVLRYIREVRKRKADGALVCPPAPPSVLGRSIADVSLLAGLLVDKFCFHLPLYRQHQRLEAAGVHLARSSLTNFVLRSGDLLKPIYGAQKGSILDGGLVAMDETPIKAGRTGPGKMRTAYFWPVYGDRHEVIFPFSLSRAGVTVREVLGDYRGVLLTDGYQAYERFVAQVNGVVHALCWSHARRWFLKAEGVEPVLTGQAVELIRRLYEEEARLKRMGLDGGMRLEHRALRCKPIVDELFAWLRRVLQEKILLPSNPFTEAAGYALAREAGLRVFLEYPDVPLDTNHLEREIRPIAVGRKNWLFCWTEVGAETVGVVQSLIATCRLQEIDPYTYLVDVLQRVDSHPAADVASLTPRLWKERFAANPLRSDVDRLVKNAVS